MLQAQVDEAGPGDIHAGDRIQRRQPFGQHHRQIPGFHSRRLGQHHGGVGGDVAMGGFPGRFDGYARRVQPRRQGAGGGGGFDRIDDPVAVFLKDVDGIVHGL